MQPRKNEKYNWGWSDPRAYNYNATPTEPTHTRTLMFELINDPYTSTIKHNMVIVHNDQIHGVTNGDTNSERV
jgi:hypothetical protein